jgi:3-oxoadipate enol-lactonase
VQTIAYKYPKLVKSVVISNSFTKPYNKLILQTKGFLALRKDNTALENLLPLVLSTIYSQRFLSQESTVASLIQLMVNNPYPMSMQGYANQAHALLHFDSSNWVSKITKPCLVITADEDFLATNEQAKELVTAIPNAKFYCFQQAGHLPHIEHPEAFSKLILDFIDEALELREDAAYKTS